MEVDDDGFFLNLEGAMILEQLLFSLPLSVDALRLRT